jgi:hypothetical protein
LLEILNHLLVVFGEVVNYVFDPELESVLSFGVSNFVDIQEVLSFDAPILLLFVVDQEVVFCDEASFFSVTCLDWLRTNLVKTGRDHSDEQVHGYDGCEHCVQEEKNSEPCHCYLPKVIEVKLSKSNEVNIKYAFNKPSFVRNESILRCVGIVDYLEAISEGHHYDDQNSQEHKHLVDDQRQSSNKEVEAVEYPQEVQTLDPQQQCRDWQENCKEVSVDLFWVVLLLELLAHVLVSIEGPKEFGNDADD